MPPTASASATSAAASNCEKRARHHRRHHQSNNANNDNNNNATATATASDDDKDDDFDDDDDDQPLQAYIPSYLRPWVHYHHGDFCQTRQFHPQLLTQLAAEGFLTIATAGGRVWLPKLHAQRSVICWNTQPQRLFHVSKSTRKKAAKYYWTTNRRFDDVVAGCRRQHGGDGGDDQNRRECWLYPSLASALATLHATAQTARVTDTNTTTNTTRRQVLCPVRVVSIEIYQKRERTIDNDDGHAAGDRPDKDKDNGMDDDDDDPATTRYRLVAGELGYTVGTMYTSLTGFSSADGAGTVQLAATGRVLQAAGFDAWDLGMDMAYKRRMGAARVARRPFVGLVRQCRARPTPTSWLDSDGGGGGASLSLSSSSSSKSATTTCRPVRFQNCRTLLDQTAAQFNNDDHETNPPS